MKPQHNRPQEKALRRLAVPMVAPASGLPLIRSVANLGRMLEWRKGRSEVDADMPENLRKRHVYESTLTFIKWMEQEDGAHFRGQVKVSGPFPHFEPQQNDLQVGDRGATRERARSVEGDVSNNGKEDYVIEALFDVPEFVNEIPVDVAVDIFGKGGRSDLKPLREKDFERQYREVQRGSRN